MPLKRIAILPNLITLANGFCGLLAISWAVDALTLGQADPAAFYDKLEAACFLIFLGMVFDALDGWVARLARATSEFGAQLDSFSDLITFGIAPAFLAKVLIEHEGPLLGYEGNPRLHFLAAACFSILALLRLARFTLETEPDPEEHKRFRGLPSPAAAGAVTSWLWMFLILRQPALEGEGRLQTPVGAAMDWIRAWDWSGFLAWAPPLLALWLPALGLLMISRIGYPHGASLISERSSPFSALVVVVFCGFLLFLAPVPVLFVVFNGFAVWGVLRRVLGKGTKGQPPAGDLDGARGRAA